MPVLTDSEVIVLGGGLCGLAAGVGLGDRAIVLERDARPGGLVRTEQVAGHWIDRVVHLLYFDRPDVEAQLRSLIGPILAERSPEAWVETAAGAVPYPLQSNLHHLPPEQIAACLYDLAEASFQQAHAAPANYEEFLLRQFGRSLCELFFFPYNRKLWQRDLAALAPTGFQWNIARTAFRDALTATLRGGAAAPPYNARGYYPRLAQGAQRGSELIAQALARAVPDLRLQHCVQAIHPADRSVTVATPAGLRRFRYGAACLSTLPLPQTLDLLAEELPPGIAAQRARLLHNRVIGIGFALRGPRPAGLGCWRYFTDPSLVFTRAVFMHEFDPQMSPPDGWSILVEIPQRAEQALPDLDQLSARAWADLQRTSLPLQEADLLASAAWVVDPAYVVFTPDSAPAVQAISDYLAGRGLQMCGRYGRWEYSSMARVMGDGFDYARAYGGAGASA